MVLYRSSAAFKLWQITRRSDDGGVTEIEDVAAGRHHSVQTHTMYISLIQPMDFSMTFPISIPCNIPCDMVCVHPVAHLIDITIFV